MYIHQMDGEGESLVLRRDQHFERRAYEGLLVFIGRPAVVRDRASRVAGNVRQLRFRENLRFWFASSGTGVFQSHQQRGAAARSPNPVSSYGAIFECEPPGPGRGVFSARLKEFEPRLTDT